MIRIILIAAVVYLIYRFFWKKKSKISFPARSRETTHEDVLVQDPCCKTYVPRGQATTLKHGGETLYFCSPECRERFLSREESQEKG